MLFEVDHVRVTVRDASAAAFAWLTHYLSAPDRQAYWQGKPEGAVTLVDRYRQAFPTGLLPLVVAAARDAGQGVMVLDGRDGWRAGEEHLTAEWLRPDQRAAVVDCLRAGRGIVSAPTGAGKTELFVALTEHLNTSTLIVVPRAALLEQTAERFERRVGRAVARFGEGHHETGQVIVATVQAAARDLRRPEHKRRLPWRTFRAVIVDECQSAGSPSTVAVLNACERAGWRWGFSATPLDTHDAMTLRAIGVLGPICATIEAAELVEAGVLVPPTIRMLREPADLSDGDAATWADAQLGVLALGHARNARIVHLVRQLEPPTLVFVTALEHGEQLSRDLGAAGVKTDWLYGKHPQGIRAHVIDRLRRADLDCLVSNVILRTGWDFPELRSLVNAGGGQSTVQTIQTLGRGMRAAPGKDRFAAWDLWDVPCCAECGGRGHRICRWLQRHARARKRAYESRGWPVEIVDAV